MQDGSLSVRRLGMPWLLAAWVLCLLAACRTPAPTNPSEEPPSVASAHGEIELARIEPGRWRATYHLARPAETLRFMRPAQWFRERAWTVETPGYALARDGNSQILTLEDGATPSETIAVVFGEYTEVMRGEYRAIQPFSDGAVALYTGHLYARDTADEANDRAPYLDTLTMQPPAGSTIAMLGTLVSGDEPMRWADPYHEGIYLYVSAPGAEVEPLQTAHMTSIVDPGVPPRLREWIAELFPPMFDALAAGHGVDLPWRPIILVAWEEGREGTRDWAGGTRPGQITMSLAGSGWMRDDPGARIDLAYFIAHEATHFWNGQLANNREDGGAWLHEGAADAIAELLLHRLGLVDETWRREQRELALNRCLSALDGTALVRGESRAGRQVHYPCGHLMATWSEEAIRDGDLLGIWAGVLKRARRSGGRYDRHDYFEVLRMQGADAEVLAAMEAFTTTDFDDQIDRVVAGFALAGLTLAPGGRPPLPARVGLAAKALLHLQGLHCKGYSLSTLETSLRTHPVPDCPTFSVDAEVHAIAGIPVADGDSIFDRVEQMCAAGDSVLLADADGGEVLSVPCTRALGPRRAWLSLAP